MHNNHKKIVSPTIGQGIGQALRAYKFLINDKFLKSKKANKRVHTYLFWAVCTCIALFCLNRSFSIQFTFCCFIKIVYLVLFFAGFLKHLYYLQGSSFFSLFWFLPRGPNVMTITTLRTSAIPSTSSACPQFCWYLLEVSSSQLHNWTDRKVTNQRRLWFDLLLAQIWHACNISML